MTMGSLLGHDFAVLVVAVTCVLSAGAQDGSVYGQYDLGAVATDGRPCAEIGTDVLLRDGTAVDAAIATLLCDGLFNAHSMGVGGGFFMTVYLKESGETAHLNARETAPHYATEDMYEDDPSQSSTGPMAGGVPGEFVGYWEAKQRYGNPDVSWESLFQPAIDMCRNGVEVGWSLADALESSSNSIKNDPGLSGVFLNPETGEVWEEGDFYVNEMLAQTLELVAANGPDEFRTGVTAVNFIQDIQDAGGEMDLQDLLDYQVLWTDTISVEIDGMTMYSGPPPSSGSILGYMVNTLENYEMAAADLGDPVVYQRIAEAFKFGYAKRSEMGDPMDPAITDFVNEMVANITSEEWAFSTYQQIDDERTYNDPAHYGASGFNIKEQRGTAHTSVLAPNGDAVAVTSTINYYFGSKFMSPNTGMILNNEMSDFDFSWETNSNPNNYPIPGKRPLSSMCPNVMVGADGNVRLVGGAAGGTLITTSVAWNTVHNLWLGLDVKEALDTRRLHHQLTPMTLYYESGFDQDALDYLESAGHVLSDDYGISVCNLISWDEDEEVEAAADGRKDGGVDGIDEGDIKDGGGGGGGGADARGGNPTTVVLLSLGIGAYTLLQ